MSIASPSASVSVASTSNWFDAADASESSATVASSLLATGLSGAHVTVTDTVAVSPPLTV